jgi:3',5'-cyclic AMP phosphodiesterase CpdA
MLPRRFGVLLHISDLHFGREHDPTLSDSFLGFVDGLPSPDVVIASGDFSFNGEESSFEQAREFLLKLIAKVEVPRDRLFVVPGNHDFNRFTLLYAPVRARRSFEKHLGEFCRLDDWVFLEDLNLTLYLLDSNRFSPLERLLALPVKGLSQALAGGKLGKAALSTLRQRFAELSKTNERANDVAAIYDARRRLNSFKVAVLHHHPLPIPVVGEDLLSVVLDSGDFLELASRCGFDLVLHGHQHFPFNADVKYWRKTRQSAQPDAVLVSAAGALGRKESDGLRANHFSLIEFDASDPASVGLTFHSYSHNYGEWGEFIQPQGLKLDRKERGGSVITRQTLNLIAKGVGYKRRVHSIDVRIGPDGSASQRFRSTCESLVSKLRQIHVSIASESSNDHTVTLRAQQSEHSAVKTDDRVDADGFLYIYFDPFLPRGGRVEYDIDVQSPPGTYRWSRSELQELRKGKSLPEKLRDREYFLHLVSIPTDELRMELDFGGRDVEPVLEVWTDENGSENRVETRRVNDLLPSGAHSFTVHEPLFGARYVWSWRVD